LVQTKNNLKTKNEQLEAHPLHLPYYDDRMCEFICTIPEKHNLNSRIEEITKENEELKNLKDSLNKQMTEVTSNMDQESSALKITQENVGRLTEDNKNLEEKLKLLTEQVLALHDFIFFSGIRDVTELIVTRTNKFIKVSIPENRYTFGIY